MQFYWDKTRKLEVFHQQTTGKDQVNRNKVPNKIRSNVRNSDQSTHSWSYRCVFLAYLWLTSGISKGPSLFAWSYGFVYYMIGDND
jgi:hypothetical protein